MCIYMCIILYAMLSKSHIAIQMCKAEPTAFIHGFILYAYDRKWSGWWRFICRLISASFNHLALVCTVPPGFLWNRCKRGFIMIVINPLKVEELTKNPHFECFFNRIFFDQKPRLSAVGKCRKKERFRIVGNAPHEILLLSFMHNNCSSISQLNGMAHGIWGGAMGALMAYAVPKNWLGTCQGIFYIYNHVYAIYEQ